MNKVLIGKILKPKGLDGTLKITNFTLGELAPCFKSVFIDSICYHVLRGYVAKEFVYLKLQEINDVDEAQNFRDKEIFGDRDELKIEDGKFLISDLIGLDVFVEDVKIGFVDGIENYGAGDIFSIKTRRGNLLVPKTERLVFEINLDEKYIKFNKQEFDEVKV